MKEAFVNLKQVFPEMPRACDQALMATIYSVQEKQNSLPFRPARRIAILVAALLAITCAAGAAFYPQIISWFTSHYGGKYGGWMEKGGMAIPHASIVENGAIFTVDEVLVRGRGLYVMGTIRAADGYILVDSECSAQEPWGYNVRHGETAPDGTPSIAQKAKENGSIIRYVHCRLEKIGVDGGALLSPGSWGCFATMQRDGSIVFTMEVEDGLVIEPGTDYTLALHAQTYGANADGSINYDDASGQTWSITVTPGLIEQR